MSGALRSMLEGDALDVAPKLLGFRLRTGRRQTSAEVAIVEVEAYRGEDDPASHAFGGRTLRNACMFERPGTLYVYRSYGVHWCANIVTGEDGVGQAILIRAGRPVAGTDLMRARRGRDDHLCDGPGKLCEALAITGDDDGIDLLAGRRVQLLPGRLEGITTTTPRLGISKAKEKAWRWVLLT